MGNDYLRANTLFKSLQFGGSLKQKTAPRMMFSKFLPSCEHQRIPPKRKRKLIFPATFKGDILALWREDYTCKRLQASFVLSVEFWNLHPRKKWSFHWSWHPPRPTVHKWLAIRWMISNLYMGNGWKLPCPFILNWLALEFQDNMIMISEWHPNPRRSPRYLISAEVPPGKPQKWLQEHMGSHKTSQIHGKFLTTSVSLCHVYPNKHPAIGFGKRGFHYGRLNKYTVIPCI